MKSILFIALIVLANSVFANSNKVVGTYNLKEEAHHYFKRMSVKNVKIFKKEKKYFLKFGQEKHYGEYVVELSSIGDTSGLTFDYDTQESCDGCGCFGIAGISGYVIFTDNGPKVSLFLNIFDEDERFIGLTSGTFVKRKSSRTRR